MSDQLESIFGHLAEEVPHDLTRDDDFVFRIGSLPPPPVCLETDRIILRKSIHDYNSWLWVDQLALWVEKDMARQLGLFLLSCVFHRPLRAQILLTNPASEIRDLVYRCREQPDQEPPVGLSLVPLTFRYFPEVTRKHPWCDTRYAMERPLLALSNADEFVNTDEQLRDSDTVFVESSQVGTVRLAELLLNAGCFGNSVREYELEGEAGFLGVAPMSAELRIWLPGSFGWDLRFCDSMSARCPPRTGLRIPRALLHA